MRTFIIAMATMASLAACSTPAEQAASAQRDIDHKVAVYGPACDKLGYTANSDQWRNCVLQLSGEQEARSYASYPYYPYHYRGFWYY